MVQASAPGKIILFGEHAVVYNQPAIAVPVTDVETTASVQPNGEGVHRIRSREVNLDVRLDTCEPDFWGLEVVGGIKSVLGLESIPPFTMTISSTIPVSSGLGSGAAVAVAAIRALLSFLQASLDDEQINQIAFEVEKRHHGTPSGIDNTVITYERPVYFVREQPIQVLDVREAFTIVIADTGIRTPTAETVGDVRRMWLQDPSRYEAIFMRIGEIAQSARDEIESGNPEELGPLMNTNHKWLCAIGVSSSPLDALVTAAREAGAAGAKLSGGGRGGNMVALTTPESAPAISQALLNAGAVHTITTTIGA